MDNKEEQKYCELKIHLLSDNTSTRESTESLKVESSSEPLRPLSLAGATYLFIIVFCGSAILPFNMAIPVQNTFLKLSWRTISSLFFMYLLCFVLVNYYGVFFSMRQLLNRELLYRIALATFCYFMSCTSYFICGELTIFSHAGIFTNLGGALVIIYKLTLGESIHSYTMFGALICFLGCIVTLNDHQAEKVDKATQNIILGDLIGIITSIFITLMVY